MSAWEAILQRVLDFEILAKTLPAARAPQYVRLCRSERFFRDCCKNDSKREAFAGAAAFPLIY
jgi:hypothetical protein